MFEWTRLGLGVGFVLGGAVLDLTAFRWDVWVDLIWEGWWSCCGWGSLRFNSLQMGCSNGCLGRNDGLVVGGAVLDSTACKWDVWVDLIWEGWWSCCGWTPIRPDLRWPKHWAIWKCRRAFGNIGKHIGKHREMQARIGKSTLALSWQHQPDQT